MSKITLKKKDDVYLYVDADPDVLLELNDFFTFAVPGAQFTPQYRAKLWDGKIRLLSIFTRELYVGLLPYVREFCKNNSYEFHDATKFISDDIASLPTFIQSLNYHSNGKPVARSKL